MKTLDEAIAELEDEGVFPDALHYLKEYRKLDSLDNIAFREDAEKVITCPGCHSEFVLLPEQNDPLTWQELRQMEGKPVWVELPRSNRKAWGLNDGVYMDAFGHDIITIKVLHDLWHLDKAQIGRTWQAYRKERE